MSKTNQIPNRLKDEKSPYLQQHTYNPVNWFPWCGDAFEKAKIEGKPIFLSIGYSTCHWCHVMEYESFEDKDIADFLNQNYISIKVDREERPDVDSVYMNVCQRLTGSGGWPLSIFMDADKKPFYAGTYFPKENYRGMAGFINILKQIDKIWKENKEQIHKASDEIIKSLEMKNYVEKEISIDIIEKSKNELRENFDKTYGGFFGSPKFPSPQNLLFLLRADETNDLVISTLDNMHKGGIYDHIGYGFHRYSTDKKWLIPHFEKMLYDNALMAIAYSEAYKDTNSPKYKTIAEEILTYILRDMLSEEGGFYSAEDADSCGVEGKFYVWDRVEILEVLGATNGEKFCQRYNITDIGNFEGVNIPNLIGKPIETEDQPFYNDCINTLFMHREKRVHPSKDKKILTSWNGLMIAALSICGKALDNNHYILKAKIAADFILETLMPEGKLKARYCDGEVKFDAFAEDYSFLTWGLIELYQACYDENFLEKAIYLTEQFIEQFWDKETAGFFLYGENGEKMISRPKEIYDGAMPSANSVSIYNLIRLARLTGRQEYEHRAVKMLNYFANQIQSIPTAHTFSLISLWYLNSVPKDVVIVCENEQNTKDMINVLNKIFRPNVTSLLVTEQHKKIKGISPFTKDYPTNSATCRAYVCAGHTCKPPVESLESFENLLH